MANVNDLFSVSTGYFGSAYLDSTGSNEALQNLTTDSDHHCVAITMLSECTFNVLTAYKHDGNASAYVEINAAKNPGFGKAVVSTDTFPTGVTIYGRWTAVTLESGKALCYVAPSVGAHPGLSTSAS